MDVTPPNTQSTPAQTPSGMERTLAWAGMAAIVFVVAFGARLSETIRYPVTLLPLALLGVIALFPVGGRVVLRRMVREVWPVAAFAAASMIAYFITASRYTGSHTTRSLVLLVPFAWIAAAVLGYRGRVEGSKPLLVAAWSVLVLSITGAMIGVTYRAGLATGLGSFYEAWNSAVGVAPTSREWMIRSVGFELDPNTFGLIGALLLVVGLAVPARAWVRWGLVVGASLIVVLSGSRTALGAVVLAVLTYVLVRLLVKRAVTSPVSVKTVIAAGLIAAIVVVALGVVLARASQQGAPATGIVEETLSGRLSIWGNALALYSTQPMGLFQPPEAVLGMSVHNEYIERLFLGGPLLLLALVAMLIWLAARVRPATAPALGPCLAVVYAAAALTLGPSLLQAFTSLLFYAVGWGLAERLALAPDGAARDDVEPVEPAADGGAENPAEPAAG